MPQDKDLITSLAVSVTAHALFLALAAYVSLGPLAPPPEKRPKELHVKIASEKPLRRMPITRAGSEGPVTTVPGYGGPVSDALATGIDDPASKGLRRDEDFTELLVRERMEEERALPDKRAADRAKTEVTKRPVRDDVVATDPEALLIPRKEEFEVVPEEEEIPKEFTTEMPGFTPVSSASKADTVSYKPLRGAAGQGALGGGGGGAAIDEYLLSDLVVYTDPDDGMRYFKITIMAGKEAERFTSIPKDMTFLIDCSLSIQPELAGFKKGLHYCLDNLNADDTFNLVRFDSSAKPLSRSALAATPASVALAKAFVDRLLPSSITDLYGALQDAIREPVARRPSYIVILSDGRPTAGVRNSRQIIAKATSENRAPGRPLFVFASGGRINRYLVDFLAFCNRGWAEYAGSPSPMSGELATFYDKIKDPIILAPKYRFSGVAADEVYPKALSDLFRGVSFVIYGRYKGDLDEFSMQLTGEAAAERVEFIFADSFKRAREGSRDIARQWAYNKIYHLIGVLAEKGSDPAIASQVRGLYEKFGITTPYAEGLT